MSLHCKRRVAWPVERWSTADQAAWVSAQQPGSPMTPAGAAAKWRPASKTAGVGAYGRYLAHLAESGGFDAAAGPAAGVTAANLRPYVKRLQLTCESVTVCSYIAILCMMAQALAPKRNWRWLEGLRNNLKVAAVPSRDKRSRIVPQEDLVQLGLDLMAAADAATKVTGLDRHTALLYRDGLLIALLANRPLRQKNFVAIEIGRQMIPAGNGQTLTFTGSEMKGRRPLKFGFPDEFLPMLARYLAVYRPYLLALWDSRGQSRQGTLPAARHHLWVTQYGSPFSASAQRKALKKHTTARFGHFVNPHLFRDCAVTSIAINDPDHVQIAALILGHASLNTTEEHYIHAQSHIALGKFQNQLLALRTTTSHGESRAHKTGAYEYP